MASALSEHGAGEAPAKKPWSRPTFYVLTDVIQSHGSPSNKPDRPAQEDESIPPLISGSSRYKSYRPMTA